jgi:predicted GIY-YIG superfamily endonuclease
MDREWFFYMLRCKDDSIYSGIALDVAERLKQHNNGTGARYTAAHRPAVLIYWERFNSVSAAMRRETRVKKLSRDKKEQLVWRFFDMDAKVERYLEKTPPPQKEICLKLRQIILQVFPDITEAMKSGVPAYAGGLFIIRVRKNQVNLGISIQGLTEKQIALFPGSGRTLRHLKFRALADVDEKKIVKLLKIAGKGAKPG